MISEVVKYTNVASVTDESVLFMKVSSIQWCPYRETPNTVYIYLYCMYIVYTYVLYWLCGTVYIT